MIDLYYMIQPYNKIYLSLIYPGRFHNFYLVKGIIRTEYLAVAVQPRCLYTSSGVMIWLFKSTSIFVLSSIMHIFPFKKKKKKLIPLAVHLLLFNVKGRWAAIIQWLNAETREGQYKNNMNFCPCLECCSATRTGQNSFFYSDIQACTHLLSLSSERLWK